MARTPLYKAAETEMIRRIEQANGRSANVSQRVRPGRGIQGQPGHHAPRVDDAGGHGPSEPQAGARNARGQTRPGASGSGGWHTAPVGRRLGHVRGAPGEIRPAGRRCRRGGAVRHRPPVPCGTPAETRRRARGNRRTSPSPKASPRPRRGRTAGLPRLPGAPMGCGPPSKKRSAPTSRRCRSPSSLSCDRHTPLLVVTRTARNEAGKPIARQVMRLIADGLSYG
jgi:hypothetical protein